MLQLELKYSSFYKEGSSKKYSIDFLFGNGKKISPVEVKSSGYQQHSSIDEFVRKYHSIIDKSYIIYGKNLKVDGDYIYLPVYMAFCL